MQRTPSGGAPTRVAVVGAGIAGLVSAKVLLRDGFAVTVYDKEDAIGGVWTPSRTYPGLRTNNPRETYAFSDFPYPPGTSEFPAAEEVRAYLEAYADHFELKSHMRLGREVGSVARNHEDETGTCSFRVISRPNDGQGKEEARDYDHVVICNGVFCQPAMPHLDGMEQFDGEIVHSSRFGDPRRLSGKRVVVIGAGKSALDCAAAAALNGADCTLVCRRPHWMLPRYIFGRVRMDRRFFTRLAEMLLPLHHSPTRGERFLHGWAAPAVRLWWAIQNRLLPRMSGMPPEMRPQTPLPHGIETIGIGGRFYEVLNKGLADVRRAGVARFCGPDELELDDGTTLKADCVVCATGWRQDISFLDPTLRRAVRPQDAFRLYRHILPPAEPQMGFVGYASSSASPLTSELAAHWLSQWFRGELTLPDRDAMEAEVDRVLGWLAGVFPGRSEGYFIGAYIAHYADELMRDMRLATRRAKGFGDELTGPLWAERYAGVAAERAEAGHRYTAPHAATVPPTVR